MIDKKKPKFYRLAFRVKIIQLLLKKSSYPTLKT